MDATDAPDPVAALSSVALPLLPEDRAPMETAAAGAQAARVALGQIAASLTAARADGPVPGRLVAESTAPPTLLTAADAVSQGRANSLDLVEQCLARLEVWEPFIGSFTTVHADRARHLARRLDRSRQQQGQNDALGGAPIAVKDIICTSEGPTSAQSRVQRSWQFEGDAESVARVRRAGGTILGKTTTLEFALGLSLDGDEFPLPRNPWDRNRWAGGSSSGSASAVATGAALASLGTDTAGSIRIPSAFCGVTGLMPTFGLVPTDGCHPLAETLDHLGPIARDARSCALLLDVLAGNLRSAPLDSAPTLEHLVERAGDLSGVRIGVAALVDAGGVGQDPAVPRALEAAVAELESRGAEIVDVTLPLYEEATLACAVLLTCEALAHHRGDLTTQWCDYLPGSRRMLAVGSFYDRADIRAARQIRRAARSEVTELLRGVDVVVTPTAGCGAPGFDSLGPLVDGIDPTAMGPVYTLYWDLLGGPALTVPMGTTDEGLPLGLQIAGSPFGEELVLRVGDAFQAGTDWHLATPPPPTSGGA